MIVSTKLIGENTSMCMFNCYWRSEVKFYYLTTVKQSQAVAIPTGIFRYFIITCLDTNVHVSAQTWLWPHDLGTNMCGHKLVWAQTCVGTIVSGHNRVWAQSCLGTNMWRHKRVWAQSCVGTNVCGHNRVWAQSCVGTIVCGHNRVWAQSCVGTIVCGHNRVWAQSCVGTIVCGHNRAWAQSCLGTIVSGHNRVWAQSCLGTIVSGHNRVWAQSCGLNRVGSIIYGPNRVVSINNNTILCQWQYAIIKVTKNWSLKSILLINFEYFKWFCIRTSPISSQSHCCIIIDISIKMASIEI